MRLLAGVLAGVMVLGGCAGWPGGAVRTTRVSVRPECPEPPPCPDPLGPIRAVGSLSEREAREAWGKALEDALVRGTPEDRVRLLALTLVLPPSREREAAVARALEPRSGPESTDLERLLRRVLAARPAPGTRAPARDRGAERAAALKRDLGRARARVRELQGRVAEQEAAIRALERQIEELKAIEQIMERREGVPAGKGP